MIQVPQPGLDLRNGDGTRSVFQKPLVGMDWLRAEMCRGRDEDFVLTEVADRRLRWAFDLRRKGGAHLFLHVWRKGFEHWQNPKTALPESWRDFYRAIFPNKSFFDGILLGTDLQDSFSFGSDHVYDLIADGLIEAKEGWRQGPGGSAQIKRVSVEKFLQQRRLD